jgi:hypothetical protein
MQFFWTARLMPVRFAGHCFPDDEQPFFRIPEERDVAAQLQCPLHGVRFDIRRTMHIYVAKWRWENEVNWRRSRLSTQYHKAWQASLPPEPGEPPFPQHRPASVNLPRRDALSCEEGRDLRPTSSYSATAAK